MKWIELSSHVSIQMSGKEMSNSQYVAILARFMYKMFRNEANSQYIAIFRTNDQKLKDVYERNFFFDFLVRIKKDFVSLCPNSILY